MLRFGPVLLVLLLCPRLARADQVDRLIGQLRGASDYKVRLSAALNLAKIGDRRAIPVFLRALRDGDKTVRGVAAAGLGKLVNSSTPAELRGSVLAGLRTAAARDPSDFVRKQAQKAHDTLRRLNTGPALAAGSIYVNIGPMSADGTGMRALMRDTVARTITRTAPRMATQWPGTAAPTAAQLRERRVTAYHVDGRVVGIRASGGVVECNVSMLLATYPEKSMFGFLKGGAKVEAGDSREDVDSASQDCVSAVTENLIASKIIPTILARTGE